MTLRSSDLQSDSDLDSIRNSCDVFYHNVQEEKTRIGISVWPRHLSGITAALQYNTRNDDGDKRLVR